MLKRYKNFNYSFMQIKEACLSYCYYINKVKRICKLIYTNNKYLIYNIFRSFVKIIGIDISKKLKMKKNGRNI